MDYLITLGQFKHLMMNVIANVFINAFCNISFFLLNLSSNFFFYIIKYF